MSRVVAGLFTNTTASVVFFGALHRVRCLTKQVPLLGSAAHKAHLVQPRLNFQVSLCQHVSARRDVLSVIGAVLGGLPTPET